MIKLLNIGEINGVMRLQSQLMIGRDSADFILEKGKLKNWCYKNGGVDFYETDIIYEIVTKEQVIKQEI